MGVLKAKLVEPVLKRSKPVISFEEYLRQEQESDTRHEFHDGELISIEATTNNGY